MSARAGRLSLNEVHLGGACGPDSRRSGNGNGFWPYIKTAKYFLLIQTTDSSIVDKS